MDNIKWQIDACFCTNKSCKDRNRCARNIENFNQDYFKDKWISQADFNCSSGDNMFIKIPLIGL
ncbi:hypothetical protein [Clostridium perfringens]|uniref:hypothetical protein n=1 Tax=Clostridium perfringens TaxID=1502 RepID=UPI00096A7AD0|nr:hypothetical protein [Clostridium perfringens]